MCVLFCDDSETGQQSYFSSKHNLSFFFFWLTHLFDEVSVEGKALKEVTLSGDLCVFFFCIHLGSFGVCASW